MTTDNKPQTENQRNEAGALWVRKTKAGKQFLTGNFNLKPFGVDKIVSIVAFKNDHKQKDTHPDFRIYESVPLPPRDGSAPAKATTQAPQPKSATPAPAATTSGSDLDI